MTIHKDHLRALVRDTLRFLEPEIPYTEAAVELLMLTAAQETQLGRYLLQIKGPARGIFQMEPATETHLLDTLERRKPEIYAKIMKLNAEADGQGTQTDRDMVYNLAYAAAMARANYFMKPGPIPLHAGDLARYYKRWWNTPAGKATEAEALANYCQLCLPVRDA